ncbi:MAG: NADH-quinone oxidoreductase subunit N [Planctomycetota bacterium]
MIERLAYLWPEIALFASTCIVMVLGLSHSRSTRKMSAVVAGAGLIASLVLAIYTTPHATEVRNPGGQTLLPDLARYSKVMIAGVGLLLLLLAAGTVDRDDEDEIAAGRRTFDPLRSNRAEFYAFFLFSITGLMLCASAADLVWLFLALELTSLPTYIMVAISTNRNRSKEAAVKYFFLGAMGAAIFLFGFAFIYGGTGSTKLNVIAEVFGRSGINGTAMTGLVLAVLGLGFKIAAVPMHFYTADVYQGAAAQVSGFLAFVPKTAGFIALMLLMSTVRWNHGDVGGSSLPEALRVTLWVMAALTMTVGNVLAIWQTSVKRVLAYSSIAHSGYMLVGIIAGPGGGQAADNGLSAVLFYLLGYGLTNVGTFAVLAALERTGPDGRRHEIDSFADLRGLCKTRPMLGWVMVLCSMSLLGFPPLLGFFAKLPLFTAGISAGELPLVVILGVNSAIAAFYYLRFVQACLLESPDEQSTLVRASPFASRGFAALLSGAGVVVLVVFSGQLLRYSHEAGKADQIYRQSPPVTAASVPSRTPSE